MCEADIRFVVRQLALCGVFENQMILKTRLNHSEQHMGLIMDTGLVGSYKRNQSRIM